MRPDMRKGTAIQLKLINPILFLNTWTLNYGYPYRFTYQSISPGQLQFNLFSFHLLLCDR